MGCVCSSEKFNAGAVAWFRKAADKDKDNSEGIHNKAKGALINTGLSLSDVAEYVSTIARPMVSGRIHDDYLPVFKEALKDVIVPTMVDRVLSGRKPFSEMLTTEKHDAALIKAVTTSIENAGTQFSSVADERGKTALRQVVRTAADACITSIRAAERLQKSGKKLPVSSPAPVGSHAEALVSYKNPSYGHPPRS